jgi:hypothetical protein
MSSRGAALLLSYTLGCHAPVAPSVPQGTRQTNGDAVEEAKADTIKKENAIKAAEDSASIPQLTAARGGSIGIPSADAVSGLQANVDAQLFGDKTNAETFAQLGGLKIDRNVTVDVFAELLDQDIPRFLPSSGMVQRNMFTTKLSAAGMRVRYRTDGVLLVSDIQTPECMKQYMALKASGLDPSKDVADTARKLNDCNIAAFVGQRSMTFSLGAHALRRSSFEAEGVASNGAAVEATVQKDGTAWTWFGGISAIRLTGAIDKAGSSTVEFPTFSVFRVSAGIEYRGSHSFFDTGLIPRVGAYGVAGHAWWHDPYTFDTVNPRVQSTEFEFGIYTGGKFSDKFSGIVALRMLRPFGTAQDTVFILSLMPSVSSSPKVAPAPPKVAPAPSKVAPAPSKVAPAVGSSPT